MNRQQIIDFLLTHNGDLTSRLWQRACGKANESSYILKWLDSLGLTEWQPVYGGRLKRRVLCCSVGEAVKGIQAHAYTSLPTERRGPKVKVAQNSTRVVRVLDDPTGLFSPGAVWPESQLPGFNDDITEGDDGEGERIAPQDELPIGIRLAWGDTIVENDPQRGLVVVGRLQN